MLINCVKKFFVKTINIIIIISLWIILCFAIRETQNVHIIDTHIPKPNNTNIWVIIKINIIKCNRDFIKEITRITWKKRTEHN